MNIREYLLRAIALACLFFVLLAFPTSVAASAFVVNAADDLDDGFCDDSHCSLREAINAANANPGADSITFDIPGPGPHVIMLADLLTISDDQTFIDGSSQPGYSGSPIIVLDGGGTVCRGLRIASNDNTVVGLSFVRFDCAATSAAIHVWGGVPGSGVRNLIENNYIGINASGAPAGNYCGLMLWGPRNTVRGNIISGNVLGIVAAGEKQIIEGNRIGTDPTGLDSNFEYRNEIGIWLQLGSDRTRIGGADPSEMNLISGNGYAIEITSEENKVFGNFIGTNLAGDAPLPNLVGIYVHGDENHIGGPNPGEGNIMSGNQGEGLVLDGNRNEVFGNMMGTDRTGKTSLPNIYGIWVRGDMNLIGGSGPGDGNVISGNWIGIFFWFSADNNRVIGNKIGTSIDGASPIGNQIGIRQAWDSHGNVYGGLSPNQGNLIAFNTIAGIEIDFDSHENSVLGNTIHTNGSGIWLSDVGVINRFSRNSIYGNTGLGIDLNPLGVNPNDPGDLDFGANDRLNFPEFTSVGATSVSGTACGDCIVELFISDQDPSGNGEGQSFIGSATTDAIGSFTIPASFPILSCTQITATATDASGNTSEFSENNVVGVCLSIQMHWAIIIVFALIGLGALGGLYAGRTSARSQGTTAVMGAGFGVLLTAALAGLAAVLPCVEIVLPQSSEAPQPSMDMCEQYMDPAGFSPAYGDVLEIDEDPLLEWSAAGPLPEGQIRWRVDLIGAENLELSQWTSDSHLLFSTFGVNPFPGSRYLWQVVGEQAEGSGPFEEFCTSITWRSFRLGSLPYMEGMPDVCLYTAIRNPTCRASDYVESAQIAVLQHGESAELVALNPELTHGQFELASMQQCWISLGMMDGPDNPVETCAVPEVDPAPKPADPPTPVDCSPEMDREACEASGGVLSGGPASAPICTCPE